MSSYTTHDHCRVCTHPDLYEILSLGHLVPSTFPLPSEPDPPAVPMTVVHCEACGFVQLRESVEDDALYRQYWYVSGTNELMREELRDVVFSLPGALGGKVVIDIGANDGTLLSNYQPSVHKIAFEPASNLIERLGQVADVTYNEFFPGPASAALPPQSIDHITAIAMFYDLDDPVAFVQEVDRLLTANGSWVVQMQDLAQQVETNAFDNFCFEHRGYYSLKTFMCVLREANADLHVTEAERRSINGGSLRITVRRTHMAVKPSVDTLLVKEAPWISPRSLELFVWRVQEVKRLVYELVAAAHDQAGAVDLYAASTKSSTLLQYCGIDHRLIRQAVERTPEKWGRVTAGTRIPIVSEEDWRADPARVTVMGAYQFAESFKKRESAYLAKGGCWLLPLPTPYVLSQQIAQVGHE